MLPWYRAYQLDHTKTDHSAQSTADSTADPGPGRTSWQLFTLLRDLPTSLPLNPMTDQYTRTSAIESSEQLVKISFHGEDELSS